MQRKVYWLMVCIMLSMVWGHTSYACETLDTPPQPVCCCEDDTTHRDGAASHTEDDGCDVADPGAAPDACCAVEYQSAFEDVTSSPSSVDPPKLCYPALALLHGPHAEPPAPLATTAPYPDPGWLLARARSGRSIYFSTLRLRI